MDVTIPFYVVMCAGLGGVGDMLSVNNKKDSNLSNIYGGIRVVENSLLPYWSAPIKLSDKVMVSDSFRLKFDCWLSLFFGEQVDLMMVDGVYHASPEVMRVLEMEVNNGQ